MSRSLKGKALPIPSWRAVAVTARLKGEGRSATLEPPFVGRDEELRSLKDQFDGVEREGKPRLVTIVGPAGIGKSRLAWEFEKYLDGFVETILWYEGRSPAYGEGISYWALAEMVRRRARVADSDDADTVRRRIGELLDEIVADVAERRWIQPRLTGLLGVDELPTESREELFAAWRTFFERAAASSTTMLVFWDLQWADQGLLDFIEHLLTWARTSPIMVIAEARPELYERRPGWGATVRSSTSIRVEPLSVTEMQTLLLGLVPGLADDVLAAIVGRAEGVPLYAVETLRMLIDRGVLAWEAEAGRYVLVADLPTLSIPETLHALIAARLDALPAAERSLLSDASVLGLTFTVRSLEAVSGLEGEALTAELDRLARHEVLLLDADPLSPERGQYKFVQGVVREVAYQSLAKRDRRAKHVAAARYFETLGDDELAGVLASHYIAAHDASPPGPEADALAAQARVALRAAADRATALHSLPGALSYLDQALTVTIDPHEQAALHERAATVAMEAARMDAALGHADAAERIFASMADRLGVLRTRAIQAQVKLAEHGDVAALSILRGALDEVADLPPGPDIALAKSEYARALLLSADPASIGWADEVLARPDLVSPTVVLETSITRSTALLNIGRLDEGEIGLRGAVVVADRMGNTFAGLRARNNLLGVLEPVDLEATLALTREIYDIAQRFGQRTWVQQAISSGSSSSFDAGDWDAWITEMADEEPMAAELYRHWFHCEQAIRMAYRGDIAGSDQDLRGGARISGGAGQLPDLCRRSHQSRSSADARGSLCRRIRCDAGGMVPGRERDRRDRAGAPHGRGRGRPREASRGGGRHGRARRAAHIRCPPAHGRGLPRPDRGTMVGGTQRVCGGDAAAGGDPPSTGAGRLPDGGRPLRGRSVPRGDRRTPRCRDVLHRARSRHRRGELQGSRRDRGNSPIDRALGRCRVDA